MKAMKRLMYGFIIVLVTAFVMAVQVKAGDSGDFEYSEKDGKITIVKYKGKGGNVTIPVEIEGKPVTSIADNTFTYTGLTSVTIPGSVTSIGDSAFSGCSLLASINVDSRNNYYTSVDGVLYSKDKTLLIACPGKKKGNFIIPGSVTSIGDWAFYNCYMLTSVTIPGSVTSIGDSAFYDCTSLESLTIPGSVTSIGENVFSRCESLTSVTIQNGVIIIGDSAFLGCDKLTSVNIPSSVTSIGNSAFSSCWSLKNITITNSIASIGNDAFYNCKDLTISGYKNSSAEKYARENNIPFKPLD